MVNVELKLILTKLTNYEKKFDINVCPFLLKASNKEIKLFMMRYFILFFLMRNTFVPKKGFWIEKKSTF